MWLQEGIRLRDCLVFFARILALKTKLRVRSTPVYAKTIQIEPGRISKLSVLRKQPFMPFALVDFTAHSIGVR